MSDYNLNRLTTTPFWLDDPKLWFTQTESQFWYFNVKDDLTKFHYTIAQLDKHCLTVVKNIALSPPPTHKYEALKSELLNKLRESKVNNIKKILTAEDINNRKPSEFLEYLKDLAGPEVEEEYIRSVWSSRLPPQVQWVTSFLGSSPLEKIAQLADLAINSPSMQIPENKCLADTKTEVKVNDSIEELARRVEELSTKVDALSPKSNKNETQDVSSKPADCVGATTKTGQQKK